MGHHYALKHSGHSIVREMPHLRAQYKLHIGQNRQCDKHRRQCSAAGINRFCCFVPAARCDDSQHRGIGEERRSDTAVNHGESALV